jgi:hypothetical protein
MLEMFPTVMVVAVTPVAVAPPFPPAGAWFPLAPQAPEPLDTPARVAGWLPAAALAVGECEPVDPVPLGPEANPGVLDDEQGAVVVVVEVELDVEDFEELDDFGLAVVDVVDEPDFAAVVVVVEQFDVAPSACAPVAVPVPPVVPLPACPKAPWARA